MLDTTNPTTLRRVTALVDQILAANGAETGVSTDDRLVDAGLTSMDMVNLMLAVEAEFDIMIPAADITPGNFRSIGTIQSMVDRVIETDAT